MTSEIALIGIDVRPASHRAWAFDENGDVLSEFTLPASIAHDVTFEPSKLKFELAEWLGMHPPAPVLLCGAPDPVPEDLRGILLPAPASLSKLGNHLRTVEEFYLVPGLSQANPPDMMWGDETALAGIEDLNGLVCIPGLLARHVVVDAGRVSEFTTEITGEMLALMLASGPFQSPEEAKQVFDVGIFREWVERSLDPDDATSPYAVIAANHCGQLPAELHDCALTGLMIGADIAAHYDPGDEIILIADGFTLDCYKIALETLGADVEDISAAEAVRDGLYEIADSAGLIGD